MRPGLRHVNHVASEWNETTADGAGDRDDLRGAVGDGAVPSATARAQTEAIDPLSLLLTGEDAGAAATQVRETQGEDAQSRWARRRWERDREGRDANSAPLVLENVVYAARDLAATKQAYSSEVAKQP